MRHHLRPAGRRSGPATTRGPGQVRVRFTPSLLPVLTCSPSGHDAALRGAAEALARLGRSDLGGHLAVSAAGQPRDAVTEHLAAGRAVENALHGGCGRVLLPPRRCWSAPATSGTRPGTPPHSEEPR